MRVAGLSPQRRRPRVRAPDADNRLRDASRPIRTDPLSVPPVSTVLFDFRDPAAVDGWTAIDDRVMGGVSRSRLRHDPSGHAVFEGDVSLAHGGGFASVRSPVRALGLAGASGCALALRGPPRPFKLSLFADDGVDSLAYQCGFVPGGVGWQALTLPLAAFVPSFRGRAVPGAPTLDPARVRQIGLVAAGGVPGSFALDIRRIGWT